MAKERRRPTRLLLLALLVLLVWLLLRLNQFLPGSWPGGGEDKGLRPSPARTEADPTKVRPSDTKSPPPEEPRRAPPRVHVVIRLPDGTPVPETVLDVLRRDDAQILRADGPAGAEFDDEGDVRSITVTRVEGGKDVSSSPVEHSAPPAGSPRQWVVQWPRAAPPKAWAPSGGGAPAAAPPFGLVVRDADGVPVPGATLDVRAGPHETHVVAGPDGTATVARTLGVFRACASAPGHGSACVYATTYADGPLEIRLPKDVALSTRFVDPATGTPVRARTLRLVSADGTVKTLERAGDDFAEFTTTMPADLAARTSLEVDVPGRPLVREALASLPPTTGVPQGRTLALLVRDPTGAAVAKARVEARYAGKPGREPAEADEVVATIETDSEGRASVALPADRSADVRVEAQGFAPAGLRSPPGEAGGKDVALARGVAVPVVVRDVGGKPVALADVTAVVRAGEAPARRAARTDAQGAARVEGVPAGRVEIYAHRAGLAWASVTADAREGMEPVVLVERPGQPLHLVVEDARGVPLSGVAVRSAPQADAAGAPDPMDPDGRPWTTDEHGVLSVPDLPDRAVDLYLSKPGYADEIVPKVLPGPTTWFATMVATR